MKKKKNEKVNFFSKLIKHCNAMDFCCNPKLLVESKMRTNKVR